MTDQATLVSKAEASRISGLTHSTIISLAKQGALKEFTVPGDVNPHVRLDDALALSVFRAAVIEILADYDRGALNDEINAAKR